jgi:SAM-dependent methyltransferase
MRTYRELLQRLSALMHNQQTAPNICDLSDFDEAGYLGANPDVAAAVRSGQFESGHQHYLLFGRNEQRKLGMDPRPPQPTSSLAAVKARKLAAIESLLRKDLPSTRTERLFDFLSEDLRAEFDIVDTNAVSSNEYDGHVLELIARHANGWVLDCGAGKRSTYYGNVVNFEIVAYDSTDVRGVGEVLPFVDNAFDAAISIAVLEHVKDPFRCAAELARVLKPGGELICCVPFLQPYHGYPHHYYNMTHQGLRNLFAKHVQVDRIDVYASVLPIWSLSWVISSWADGLRGRTRQDFLNMRLSEFLEAPTNFLNAPFVAELPATKNLELASACVLFGRKI